MYTINIWSSVLTYKYLERSLPTFNIFLFIWEAKKSLHQELRWTYYNLNQSTLINLSIKLAQFPDAGKIAKLKPLYKKDQI